MSINITALFLALIEHVWMAYTTFVLFANLVADLQVLLYYAIGFLLLVLICTCILSGIEFILTIHYKKNTGSRFLLC